MATQTDGDPAAELLDVVSLRYDLLSCLSTEPSEQPALVDRLDSSKATVYRGVRALEEAGLITSSPAGYATTAAGEALLAAYEAFRDAAGTVAEASELLRVLPDDAVVPPSFLRGADVVTGDPPASYEPGARIASLVEEATKIRGLAKAHTQPDAADVHHRVVVEQGTEVAFVLHPEMSEHLHTIDDERVRAIAESENFTEHGTAELPFGLFICEFEASTPCAVLIVYDDDGLLRGVLVNDTAPAVEWAEETYERYRRRVTATTA